MQERERTALDEEVEGTEEYFRGTFMQWEAAMVSSFMLHPQDARLQGLIYYIPFVHSVTERLLNRYGAKPQYLKASIANVYNNLETKDKNGMVDLDSERITKLRTSAIVVAQGWLDTQPKNTEPVDPRVVRAAKRIAHKSLDASLNDHNLFLQQLFDEHLASKFSIN